MKPFSEACERSREPILAVLRGAFAHCRSVLEIGSGTGQHAAYFAEHLPHLTWQASDIAEAHAGINAWIESARLDNLPAPLALDVGRPSRWPDVQFDAVFTANTAHIMSWPLVESMFALIGKVLVPGGVLALYGPLNYGGRYTSDSNARFDAWLKARDPAGGIRDFANVDALARSHGCILQHDISMPANNRTLVWQRLSENTA